jgi:hypothetical protein
MTPELEAIAQKAVEEAVRLRGALIESNGQLKLIYEHGIKAGSIAIAEQIERNCYALKQ